MPYDGYASARFRGRSGPEPAVNARSATLALRRTGPTGFLCSRWSPTRGVTLSLRHRRLHVADSPAVRDGTACMLTNNLPTAEYGTAELCDTQRRGDPERVSGSLAVGGGMLRLRWRRALVPYERFVGVVLLHAIAHADACAGSSEADERASSESRRSIPPRASPRRRPAGSRSMDASLVVEWPDGGIDLRPQRVLGVIHARRFHSASLVCS